MKETKVCSVSGCNRKHHAKGYCNYHYTKLVIGYRQNSIICSVPGCNKKASRRSGKRVLCDMHDTRLRRNGSVDIITRERKVQSFIDELMICDDPWNYEITNNLAYAEISRAVFSDTCMKCGWNKGKCEVHHRVHKSKGGLNTLNNAEMLCPNCHSAEHRGPRHDVCGIYKQKINQLIRNMKQKNEIV